MAKIRKNIGNLWQKFEIIFQTFIKMICKFYFKIYKTNFKISIYN